MCRRELPDLIELDRQRRAQGVVILGVSREDAATQREFARQRGIGYPLLIDQGSLPQPYAGVRAIPTTFIIDRRGMLRSVQRGYRPGALEKTVNSLLEEG